MEEKRPGIIGEDQLFRCFKLTLRQVHIISKLIKTVDSCVEYNPETDSTLVTPAILQTLQETFSKDDFAALLEAGEELEYGVRLQKKYWEKAQRQRKTETEFLEELLFAWDNYIPERRY
jgi:hypothetical protein